jgi:hypothetical protein
MIEVSEALQFRTRINPSWLAAVRVASPLFKIESPFPLMNIVAREKGVTAALEGRLLVLTIAPGEPPPTWPSRQLDMLAILQRCADAASMLEAIRMAQPAPEKVTPKRVAPANRPTTLDRGSKTRSSRSSNTPEVVSVPIGNMLSTARPEEVWAAIRERKGEPFTVEELQEKLGASVGPYVMIWARDGFLVKTDRDGTPRAGWRYRLNRDHMTHPPVG